MRRIVFSLILGILLLGFAVPVAYGDDIRVAANDAQNKFPTEIVFRLEASSSADIVGVTLRYRTADSEALSRAPADFTQGKSVKAQYSLNTTKNYLPPGTELTYYWEIQDASGATLKTDPRQFTYDDIRFSWHSVTRDNITIYYYKGDDAFANGLADAAVASVKRLSDQIGITYDKPMKIWVYNTKQDMADAQPKRSDTYEAQTTTLGVRLSAQVMLLLGSHPDVKETLAHELSHMVVHQATDNPYGDIPSWLDEGLAMYAEGSLADSYARALTAGIKDNKLLSVRQLTSYSGDPAQVNLFYAESYSIVKFLFDKYGKDQIVQLLGVFKEGSNYDAALQKVYQFDQTGLDIQWRESLGLAARPTQAAGQSTGTPQPKPTLVPLGGDQGRKDSSPARTLALVGGAGACVFVLGGLVVGLVVVLRRR